jgi:signal transduction histidine kinase
MNKLWVRLSLGFSGTVLVVVVAVVLTGILVGRSDPRLDRFAATERLAAELATYYQARQGWEGVELLLVGAQTMFDEQVERDQAFFLTNREQQVIYHPKAEEIGQPLNQEDQVELLPIRVGDQTVGYLGRTPLSEARSQGRSDFVFYFGRMVFIVAVVAGLGGIGFGILMSRSLTAPLNSMAEAARAIGLRNLRQRVEERGSDEMMAVARAFNEMVASLEQAEQLRRNLLADVAHELRTPLSVLQGNLQAILDEVYPLDQAEVARLYDHTRFLSRLVNDLHELAQAEAHQLPLDLQETNLARLVQTTTDTFRPSAEAKDIQLYTELPANLPSSRVDVARLTQVLQNLLANALRHTPAGGIITVRVEPKPPAITLTVSDTGEGIPPEHLPHVFDRFYRTDPARSRDRGGAGLGLAIVRAIVEAHGGRISVASEGIPGRGSTFTIQLFTP